MLIDQPNRKQRFDGTPGDGEALTELIQALDVDDVEALVRAFTNYFQLINLAEDSERIRRIRTREQAEPGPRRGSLSEAINLLAARGLEGTFESLNSLSPERCRWA